MTVLSSIQQSCLSSLCMQMPLGTVAVLLGISIISWIFQPIIEATTLYSWAVIGVLICLCRLAAYCWSKKCLGQSHHHQHIEWLIIAVSAASGFIWASASLLFLPGIDDPFYWTVIGLIMAGFGAGCIFSTYASLPACAVYFFPTILPIAMLCALHDDTRIQAISLLMILFMLMGWKAARHSNQLLLDSYALSQEKNALALSLEHQNQKLELANQAKSQFLATMSHELRTPIHGVIGLHSLLIKEADYLHPEHRKHLELAQYSAHTLQELVDDILDLSKIEADKLEVKHASFHLPTFLQAVLTPFLIQAQQKNLQLSLKHDVVPTHIHTDETLLRQILLNLVGNAIKFTNTGFVHIVTRHRSGQLSISIEDSGIGIPSDQLDTLFEPFVQISQHANRKGTGLGTTIAYRLASAMGGSIELSSELGVGSTFTVILPIEALDEQRTSQHVDLSEPPVRQEPICVKELHGLRVLLAEDDQISRMIAHNSLMGVGMQVSTAVHGLEAWEMIQAADFDLLITDIRMPGLSGIELTQRIRQYETSQQHHTYIIGLSAHAMQDVVQECLAKGMDDFIAKPINPDDLLLRLNACMML